MLKDIIKLPDVQLVDKPQSPTFEVHAKTASPQTFSAHHEDVKIKWLREIGQHANDPLALHEHTVDDLRIDPSQIKADTDTEAFRLPPRIDAHEPESVRPSEVAKDHYLPHPEKPKPDVGSNDKPEPDRITSTTSSLPAVSTKTTSASIESSKQVSSNVATTQSSVETKSKETDYKDTQQQLHSSANTNVIKKQAISATKTSESQLSKEQSTKETISHQHQSISVNSPLEPTNTATPSPITKDVQSPENTVVHSATTATDHNQAVTIKAPSAVEPRTEYVVTEPQSVNASSASINTIADIGTGVQIQGKRNWFDNATNRARTLTARECGFMLSVDNSIVNVSVFPSLVKQS